MASRRPRALRPGLDFTLEERRLCAADPPGAPVMAVDVAAPTLIAASRPKLQPAVYRDVMSRIDHAFEAYRGRGVSDALDSAWQVLLAAVNAQGSATSYADGTPAPDPSRERGNTSMLLNRVSNAVARLPYGARIWSSIQLDPSSITTENGPRVRDRIKREVRDAVRADIALGRVEVVRPVVQRSLGGPIHTATRGPGQLP